MCFLLFLRVIPIDWQADKITLKALERAVRRLQRGTCLQHQQQQQHHHRSGESERDLSRQVESNNGNCASRSPPSGKVVQLVNKLSIKRNWTPLRCNAMRAVNLCGDLLVLVRDASCLTMSFFGQSEFATGLVYWLFSLLLSSQTTQLCPISTLSAKTEAEVAEREGEAAAF